MTARILSTALFLALIVGTMPVLIGCGSNPPCETDISAVDAAASQAANAQSRLDELNAQRTDLEGRVVAEKKKARSLAEQKAMIETELKKLED
ncbi:MAG: hypothetical protein QF819_00580 [Gemmatimonadota bacterium]|jgi:hypothetical protein|nr:hypothetical protein [Gemmatimonadota bacterium]MDP6529097.1 hypothetical protein [Gemmatimonadota bacterium]MDP6801660.1 hypothetical protein [Gemmatimonadota bacterium]MDP7030793.1 hypothetical protein [Gemmatimonadota bacterium]